MTKLRFTDCDIWEGAWFMGLPTEMKLLWRYLCDRCDNAGVWVVNQQLAEFHLGLRFDHAHALKILAAEVEAMPCGSKWRLRNFLRFQYPNGLVEKSAPHRQVMRVLASHGLTREGLPKGIDSLPEVGSLPTSLPSTSTLQVDQSRLPGSLKDKDTETDKDKDKDTETRPAAGPVAPGADIFDPTALPGSTADIAAETRWPYERRKPWVERIAAVVGTMIHARNWPAWARLCDEKHWTLEQVIAAADALPAAKRWPDQVENELGEIPRRGPVQAATPAYRDPNDVAKAILDRDGWQACRDRLPAFRSLITSHDRMLDALTNPVAVSALIAASKVVA